MASEGAPKGTSEGGFALFIVLSFLLIAASVTTPLLTGAKIQAMVTRNTWNATREKFIYRGLLEMAGVRYFERYQDRENKPATDVGCADVTFHFQDHSGLIDLNAASAEVLAVGFESLGLNKIQAVALAGEVIRFRSVSLGLSQLSGLAEPKNGYKNALFESTAELLELSEAAGVTLDGRDGIFTVHSGTGTVDEAAAQGRLLKKLEALSAAERFFLVHDVRRGNAVTVTVALRADKRRRALARATIGTAPVAGTVRFLSPVSLQFEAAEAQDDIDPPSAACGAFFDPVMLDAIAGLAS
jgi:general secretion pathway protein K